MPLLRDGTADTEQLGVADAKHEAIVADHGCRVGFANSSRQPDALRELEGVETPAIKHAASQFSSTA